MPYLKPERRKELASDPTPADSADLNYLFTLEYIKNNEPKLAESSSERQEKVATALKDIVIKFLLQKNVIRYDVYNDVAGALNLSLREFFRRTQDGIAYFDYLEAVMRVEDWLADAMVAPYEERKIKENGDLY